ncbi:hypothetical protein [Alicyclobacillus kakegawensis]|uniref:hypothetical protein n=1 Tax=Alicyclobacillus kakegawensis TaxID=392012 RepID=UPI0008359CFE|nr:hypothetical protein [Alicyclobacillus kakegawensis]
MFKVRPGWATGYMPESNEWAPTWSYPYWYGRPVDLMPWWLRAHAYEPHRRDGAAAQWARAKSLAKAQAAAAYPVGGPWYPLPVVHPEWLDPWSMQVYHGSWWP